MKHSRTVSTAGTAARVAVATLCLSLAACPKPPHPRPLSHNGPAQRAKDPRELLRRVLARNDGFGTLTTVHRVSAEIAISGERYMTYAFYPLIGFLVLSVPGILYSGVFGFLVVGFGILGAINGATLVARRAMRRRREIYGPEDEGGKESAT